MNIFSLFLIILSIPCNVFGALLTIRDPSGLLNSIDTYIGTDFDSAFKLGDQTWHEKRKCQVHDNNGQISASCEEPIVEEDQIIEKTTDSAASQNGMIITRNQFEKINGNFLRYTFDTYSNDTTLKTVDVEMEKITFENATVNGKVIKGIRAFYNLKLCKVDETNDTPPLPELPGQPGDANRLCFSLPQEMLLGRNMSMLGQMLEFVFHRKTPIRTDISVLKDYFRP